MLNLDPQTPATTTTNTQADRFNRCYRDNSTWVRSLACRLLNGDVSLADDICQEVFVALWQQGDDVNATRVACWLHRVTVNKCIDRIRSEQARRRRERTGGERGATDDRAPDRSTDSELLSTIHEEIDRLPERLKQALVLCYIHGNNHRSAADRMACGARSFSNLLLRARRTLRARLRSRDLHLSVGSLTVLLASPSSTDAPNPIERMTTLTQQPLTASVCIVPMLMASLMTIPVAWSAVQVIPPSDPPHREVEPEPVPPAPVPQGEADAMRLARQLLDARIATLQDPESREHLEASLTASKPLDPGKVPGLEPIISALELASRMPNWQAPMKPESPFVDRLSSLERYRQLSRLARAYVTHRADSGADDVHKDYLMWLGIARHLGNTGYRTGFYTKIIAQRDALTGLAGNLPGDREELADIRTRLAGLPVTGGIQAILDRQEAEVEAAFADHATITAKANAYFSYQRELLSVPILDRLRNREKDDAEIKKLRLALLSAIDAPAWNRRIEPLAYGEVEYEYQSQVALQMLRLALAHRLSIDPGPGLDVNPFTGLPFQVEELPDGTTRYRADAPLQRRFEDFMHLDLPGMSEGDSARRPARLSTPVMINPG